MKTNIIKSLFGNMKYVTFATFVITLIQPALGVVTSYLDRSDYESSIATTWQWSFDSLAPGTQHYDVFGPDGTTHIPFTLANPLPSSFFPYVTTMSDGGIYFNPQFSKAFVFNMPVSSFGISMAWGNFYNPSGVAMELYDLDDHLIHSVLTTTADALTGPFSTSGGDTYEAFLGFESSTPIYSVRFEHLEGSVWFDNAIWATIPEPSTTVLFIAGAAAAFTFLRKRNKVHL